MYKKAILISEQYYVCEISYNKRGYFISLFNIEKTSPDLCVLLKNSEATDRILRKFENDLEMIAHSLKIVAGKIVISDNMPK